jgi:hypothetical protein
MKKTLSAKELAAVSEVLEDTAFLKKLIDSMSNSALLMPLIKLLTDSDQYLIIDLLMPEIEAEALRRLASRNKGV